MAIKWKNRISLFCLVITAMVGILILNEQYRMRFNIVPDDQIRATQMTDDQMRLNHTDEGWRSIYPMPDYSNLPDMIKSEFQKFYNVSGNEDNINSSVCDQYKYSAHMERLVIPHILAHAHNLPEDTNNVTLATHLTSARIDRLQKLFHHWDGPLSVAVYVMLEDVGSVLDSLLSLPEVQTRKDIFLHFVPEKGSIYPVNFLRNVALNHTRTRYVFMVDVDFIPSRDCHDSLLDHLEQLRQAGQVNVAFIVPAFEEVKSNSEYVYPDNKMELLDQWHNKSVDPFHLKLFAPAHNCTNFKRWMTAQTPYKVTCDGFSEPYIAGTRLELPHYSQQFVGRGFNKIQCVAEVVAKGIELRVLPQVFLVHLAHKSSGKLEKAQRCSTPVYHKFMKDLKTKYAP